MKPTIRFAQARGFTTAELLVGLVLSLFIISVSITYFVASARTFKVHTNESVVQENGRFALELLASSIRHAGVNPSNDLTYEMEIFYSGNLCPATEAGLSDGAASNAACTRDGANDSDENNSDRIAVDYVLDATKRASSLTMTLCNGHDVVVPAGNQLHLANVYWTADIDDNGVRSLYCQAINLETNLAEGAALAIVDGVERLQAQYGIDNDDDGAVERYLSFTHLGALNASKVRSVRFALLVTSGLFESEAETEVISPVTKTFKLLDGASESFSDPKVFRQVYATTVMIHNVPIAAFVAAP